MKARTNTGTPEHFELVFNVICIALLLLAMFFLAGCDDWFKTTRYNGQRMSADEVAAQAKIDAESEKAKARDDANRLTASLRAEADEQATKQARRKSEFDAAITTLDAETRIKLASLQAEYEVQSADAARAIARMQTNTENAIQHVADRTTAALADIDRRSQAANADVESKIALVSWVRDAVGQNAGAFGPVGALLGGIVTTGLGIGLGRAGRQKALDAAWDDGHKNASDTARAADAAWDAAHANTLAFLGLQKAIAPAPSAATESKAA